MLSFNYDQAAAFLTALAGIETAYDFRAIHDRNDGVPARNVRGTLAECWQALQTFNNDGFGIFVVVNETDGAGREAVNVRSVRANFVDLDRGDVAGNYQRAMQWELKPSFTVVSSPGRAHVYWKDIPHGDLERWSVLQRKLAALFDADPTIIDPPRVMRLPGSYHLKREPSLVGFYPLAGLSEAPHRLEALEWALAGVSAVQGAPDTFPLGSPGLLAPSLEWATYALDKIDPGQLDRGEWLKITAAFKASAWATGDDVARMLWDMWCAKYPGNNVGENNKLWRSIKETKTGWGYLARVAGVQPELLFGGTPVTIPQGTQPQPVPPMPGAAVPPTAAPGNPSAPVRASTGPFLTPQEQVDYFAGCVLIESMGRILTPAGRFMDTTKFNASYGGKQFVLDGLGQKMSDEPWKAATRGQVFNVPKVDHIRFLPYEAPGAIITDELGRGGVNSWRKPNISMTAGDVSPFLRHMALILPEERDVRILLNFFAHCVQRPGRKVFWAPLIQSSEGAGKGIVKLVMTHALGGVYVHAVKSDQLVESGGKFTGWMRSKLMIIADEIRVDEKRDMIEVLKPMITEDRIEIQSKGVDQEMEDNVANWVMFTNYKDAIPIRNGDRRYAIFYSTVQGLDDLHRLGMTGDYFPNLYAWLRTGGGKEAVASYLMNYPIEPDFDPMGLAHRAPITSSTSEAIIASRGRLEQLIIDAVEEGKPGFKNGWLSSVQVSRIIKEDGIRIGPQALKRVFEGLGYFNIGRSSRAFMQEGGVQPYLHNLDKNAPNGNYGADQGYV